MKSRWRSDSDEISRISFDNEYTRTMKNYLIGIIETRMAREEQLELDGKGTGYYEGD